MAGPEVTLVRHGQTEWSKAGKHTGRTDIALTDLGQRQADALGDTLGGRKFSLVLSSPLSRAWETMERAGYEGSGVVNTDLVEWDYGSYEGKPTTEIREEIPDWSVWTHPIIGGESIDEIGQRADEVIGTVLGSAGPVLAFAHGHILRIFAARWMGLPPAAGRALGLDTATVSTLGWERENRVIRTWNAACQIRSGDPVL